MKIIKKFSAKVETLHPMLLWLEERLMAFHVSEKNCHKIQLVAEELFMNAIYHAYHERGGEVVIQIENSFKFINLTFIDSGKAFNPADYTVVPNQETDITKCSIGGMGILLIQKYSDDIQYERDRNKNRVVVIFSK
ncbi:MAG TPA: ATP-binding protein [Chlamydiales bacterium]|nr:ATP-binding protein [Chlamydiales bacterium]